MNQVIAKKAGILSVVLGAIIGIASLIPSLIGLGCFVLGFLTSAIVILYMKKDEKHLSYLTNQEGAILGGIIGFFATIGFSIIFSPMVCIIHSINKSYYSYAIPDLLSNAAWLFFIIIFVVALFFALFNATVGMGTIWLINMLEGKPQNHDARLDIKIED